MSLFTQLRLHIGVGPQIARKQSPQLAKGCGAFVLTLVYALGFAAVIFFFVLCISSPTVLARFAGADYLRLTALVCGGALTYLFQAIGLMALPDWSQNVLVRNALYLALVVFAGADFLELHREWDRSRVWASYAMAALACPVLSSNAAVLDAALKRLQPSIMHCAWAMVGCGTFLLVSIILSVFTNCYAYVHMHFLRGNFWLANLSIGLVMLGASSLATWKQRHVSVRKTAGVIPAERVGSTLLVGSLLTLMALTSIVVTEPLVVSSRSEARAQQGRLRVVTYNIHQGWTEDLRSNFRLLSAELSTLDVDILALQETDTAKLAVGGRDVVRWLATQLNMHSYYGPGVPASTFGVALLSKFPIEAAHTHFLPSIGEQATTIDALVRVPARGSSDSRLVRVLVSHFGSQYEQDLVDQSRAMVDIMGVSHAQRHTVTGAGLLEMPVPLLFMCDCNMLPSSAAYNHTVRAPIGIQDAWSVATGSLNGGFTSETVRLYERIDYVFASPHLKVLEAAVLTNLTSSDHLPVFAEVQF